MIEAIDRATDLALQGGIRVLQTHFVGGSQRQHVEQLLAWMNPPQGAHIVDAGSGIGEVAKIMSELRPDLTFTLVNFSQYQLEMSPRGDQFHYWLADFTESNLPSGFADVVMFNSALCQMPINKALSEARRVLKADGQMFISDLAIDEFRTFDGLHAAFMSGAQWQDVIGRHGFAVSALHEHGDFDLSHFSAGFDDFDSAFSGAQPFIASFRKQSLDEHVDAVMDRHERVALQFSGGKDSLAVLHLLKRHWPKLTVYWTNTGDPVPEVRSIVAKIRLLVPKFVEIKGRVKEQIEAFGLPSDLVPTTSTQFGLSAYGGGTPLQDRFQCCYASLMKPMQDQMERDGITLIVRGQKSADRMKSPLRSGAIEDGIELLFPIEDWTDDQVFAWLEENAFVPDYYKELSASPDCLTCSAYWSEGRATWLKSKHPAAYSSYQRKLDTIREAAMPLINLFNLEVSK